MLGCTTWAVTLERSTITAQELQSSKAATIMTARPQPRMSSFSRRLAEAFRSPCKPKRQFRTGTLQVQPDEAVDGDEWDSRSTGGPTRPMQWPAVQQSVHVPISAHQACCRRFQASKCTHSIATSTSPTGVTGSTAGRLLAHLEPKCARPQP